MKFVNPNILINNYSRFFSMVLMRLTIVLNRLLFSIIGIEGQVTDVEQEIIITNNNLLFHFSGHNNDLLVLKQWKGALNRITPSLLGFRAQALSYI